MDHGCESALKTTQLVESSLYVWFGLRTERICRGWVMMFPNSGCHRTRDLPGSEWMPCPGRPAQLHQSTCPGRLLVQTCRASVRPCHLPLCFRRPCEQASKCLKYYCCVHQTGVNTAWSTVNERHSVRDIQCELFCWLESVYAMYP